MAYTFGAAGSDDMTWQIQNPTGGTTTSCVVCGWVYPTTLTAGRGYWGFGNTMGAEIDTTTSELRLKSQRATANGEWTTTGAGLVTDAWKFLAVFGSFTGASDGWMAWAGDELTRPQPLTITKAVAPSGSLTGSTNFYLGNKGTSATLAFEGDIGDHVLYRSGMTATATHEFGISAYGTLTQASIDIVYERFVLPAWLGDVFSLQAVHSHCGTTNNYEALAFCLDAATAVVGKRFSTGSIPPFLLGTVNGATKSARRSPRPFRWDMPMMPNSQRVL